MAEAETGRKISCLITDAFLSFAGSIAENLSIPWIPVWTPVPHSLSAHIYTDMIRQRYANSVSHDCSNSVELEDQTLDVPGLSEFRIGDLPAEVLPQRDAKRNSLFLHVSISIPPPSLPPSTEDVTGCLSWLDGQKAKSVAFISFGTVVNIPQSEIEELAEALEVSGTPFLWALRDSMSDCLPSGFLDRASTHGKVVPWAPQIQVLAHSSISVFITHCGANSVYESIANGVPMICRPFFADHKLNARLIADEWRAGGRGIRSRAQDLKELVLKASSPGGRASQDFKTLVEKITSV
ncbi:GLYCOSYLTRANSFERASE [Salix viminalis]|uniref:anthocyanidin 3-O-glucosyltransferase n=1 Tax=Salix viminalis TaxID=40686 RepID=A0A9Q0SC89_SALVM|nr:GLYCOSYLTRANSFERASE [Salix viminalis]